MGQIMFGTQKGEAAGSAVRLVSFLPLLHPVMHPSAGLHRPLASASFSDPRHRFARN
jgi:hypothetical protein